MAQEDIHDITCGGFRYFLPSLPHLNYYHTELCFFSQGRFDTVQTSGISFVLKWYMTSFSHLVACHLDISNSCFRHSIVSFGIAFVAYSDYLRVLHQHFHAFGGDTFAVSGVIECLTGTSIKMVFDSTQKTRSFSCVFLV